MARFDLAGQPSGPTATTRTIGETLFEMGLRHAAGREGPNDTVAAHMYFNLADREGVEDAAFHRQEVAVLMSKGEIATALRAARDWIAAH